jgi:hypothetical protein
MARPLKTKLNLNYARRFNSYHLEDIASCHEKSQSVLLTAYWEMKAVYIKCHTEHFNRQRGQNADNVRVYVSVKPRGAHINYHASLRNVFGLNIIGLLWKAMKNYPKSENKTTPYMFLF